VSIRRWTAGVVLALAALAGCAPATEPVGETETASAGPVSRSAPFESGAIRYFDTGSTDSGHEQRPTLVLIHGWASDSRVWEPQLASLSPRARLIAVDLPAHGESDVPEQELTMDLFAQATAAAMDDAGVDRAILVGHSNGTPVIRQFYRLFPERTAALIAVDGPLRYPLSEEQVEGIRPAMSEENYRKTVANMVEHLPGDGLDAALRTRISEMALAQSHKAVLEGFLAAANPAIWEPDPITAPLLLVIAPQPSWNEEYLAFVKELAPGAEIRSLEGASHFLTMERADEFDAIVVEFLESQGLL